MADQNLKITIKAFDKTKSAFSTATSGIKKVAGAVFSLKTAIAGAVGAGGLGLLVSQSLKSTDALAKTASKIGTTTEALAGLRFAAELTGVSTQTMDMALQRFTRRTAEAAKGTGEAKGAIRELGIDAKELNRLPLDERMLVLADAFSNVENESDRLRLAFKLFDSEGAALVNTLSQGRDGLAEMLGEAKALGLTLSSTAAKGVEDANDAFTKLQSLFKGVRDQTVAALAPAIALLADTFKNFLLEITEADGGIEKFAKGLAVNILESTSNALIGLQKFVNGTIEGINAVIRAKNRLKDFIPFVEADLNEGTIAFVTFGDVAAKALQPLIETVKTFDGEVQNLTNNIGITAPSALDQYKESLKEVLDTMPTLEDSIKSISKNAITGLTDALANGITGAANFADAIKAMAKSVVDSLIKMLIQKYIVDAAFGAITSAFGGQGATNREFGYGSALGSSDPFSMKAIGGSVQAGQPYMVGERGAEMFVPNQSGSIIPNNQLGGGGTVINQTINVSTGVQQTVRAEIATLMPQIANATKQAVADARMRGGNYSKSLVGA